MKRRRAVYCSPTVPLVKQCCKIMKSSCRALVDHPRRAIKSSPANFKWQSLTVSLFSVVCQFIKKLMCHLSSGWISKLKNSYHTLTHTPPPPHPLPREGPNMHLSNWIIILIFKLIIISTAHQLQHMKKLKSLPQTSKLLMSVMIKLGKKLQYNNWLISALTKCNIEEY